MAFLDKLFRWKKKPFGGGEADTQGQSLRTRTVLEDKPKKVEEPRGSGRLAHVIVRPHISERSSVLQESNQYVFEVGPRVNKDEMRRAVEDLYGVQPTAVKIMNIRGKNLRFGRTPGQTKKWKKAIVTLPAGRTIDVYKK